MPTAANLNLYRRRNSCVRWHCDDEPLFGEDWGLEAHCFSHGRASPVLDSEASSCCIGHGDIHVMDGQCQDVFLHNTSRSGSGAD